MLVKFTIISAGMEELSLKRIGRFRLKGLHTQDTHTHTEQAPQILKKSQLLASVIVMGVTARARVLRVMTMGRSSRWLHYAF